VIWLKKVLSQKRQELQNLVFGLTIDAQFADDPVDLSEKRVYVEFVSGVWHLPVSFPELLNQAGKTGTAFFQG
jgi:hypothetical protein